MYVTVNGIQMYYEKIGLGHPLVFVHGNGEDHTIFDSLVERLKVHYTCYLIDSRSHGKSQKTDEIHYDTMAQDVYEFITKMGLVEPYYLGFSDGGNIGIILAIDHPSLLSKMMILGANINPRGVKLKYQKEMRDAYKMTGDPLLQMMVYEPQIAWKDLHKIITETMVVVGEDDDMTYRHTKAIASHIKGSELRILKEKNHYDYVIHSDYLFEICLKFYQ
jgi:pimeloyl-ACP methyl ester carboxylesterase